MTLGMNRRGHDQVAEYANLGTFFAGDPGPVIDLIFLSTSGGIVDLTGAVIDVTIRRFDPRTALPIGAVISNGPAQAADQTTALGHATCDWNILGPVDTVPTEPGVYLLTVDLLFPDGHGQGTQRALFTVEPSSRLT